MDQPTFADLEYRGKKRKTRRELFLERMGGLVPWQSLEDRILPHYPKAGNGRRPYPLSVMLREGTIVDATIIEAPSSTKNRAGERDPEMHQTKKGNQWHFGMKAHILRQAQDGGLGDRNRSQHEHHGSQRPRHYGGAQPAARR